MLKKLLLNFADLNKEGIFIKIRLLLEYPYSISSFSRIRAETATLRASMKEPQFTPKIDEPQERLDEEEYMKSFLMFTQQSILHNIQYLEQELRVSGLWNESDNPNSITVRFTAINPEVCCLFVNNILYYDALLFSKLERQHSRFTNNCPIIRLDKKDQMEKDAFASFDDHFRYLWNHSTALDCEDATKFKNDTPKSLSKIKKPYSIRYENKISRIFNREKRNGHIKNWENQVLNEFLNYCADLSLNEDVNSLFITCSWSLEEDGKSTPNQYARLLSEYLSKDFFNVQQIFSIQILQAVASDFLSHQLYVEMNKSTIGLILMTRDIEGKDGRYYCKPNVYHELGYLMKHLGKDRLIIFREKDVYVPSNIQDVIRVEFDVERMSLRYLDVISRISEITSIENDVFVKCMSGHIKRLEKYLVEKKLNVDEFNKAKSRILNWIKEKKRGNL